MKKLSGLLAVAAIAVFITSCFSEWDGNGLSGASGITINLGGPQGKAINPAEIANMDFEIILKGPGGRINKTVKGGGSVTIQVIPGKWAVQVRGREPAAASLQPVLRTMGITHDIDVKTGTSTQVPLKMLQAVELSSFYGFDDDINNIFDENGGYILLTGSSEVTAPIGIGQGGEITILADVDVTITRGENSGVPNTYQMEFFAIDYNSKLVLGHPVMDGTITLDGSGGAPNNISLINVENGTLEMNDGVKLINNTRGSSSNGGAVSVSPTMAGTSAFFIMNGGIISGNNASLGGGVYLSIASGSEAIFTMNGGTISGNHADLGGGVFKMNIPGSFTKRPGGIIYGSGAGPNSNTASSGPNYGHAVLFFNAASEIYRNKTLNIGDTLRTDNAPATNTIQQNGWNQ